VCIDVNCRYGQLEADGLETFHAGRKDLSKKKNDIVALCMLPRVNYLIYARTEGLVSRLKLVGH